MAERKTPEQQIEALEKKMEQLKAQKKAIQAKQNKIERAQRTRRLIENGALAEKYLNCDKIEPAEFEKLLKQLVQIEQVKALAEAENETFKIDRSLQGKHIVTKSEKAAKKKEEKRIENEMRRSSDKPAFLVLIAGIFEKFLHIIVTLYTMAIVVNILFVWQIYKAVSAGGWQAVFHSKYTLFVLAYFALLFILKKVYFALYTYAND